MGLHCRALHREDALLGLKGLQEEARVKSKHPRDQSSSKDQGQALLQERPADLSHSLAAQQKVYLMRLLH